MRIVSSYVFLFCLALLLMNDLLWKELYGNWFTGKLSDFAGLFVFSVFWAAVFPSFRKMVFPLTGILFILFKLPIAQPVLDLWNSMGFLSLGRTVDYSDFSALLILPFAYRFSISPNQAHYLPLKPALPILFSLFAFAATSYISVIDVDKSYEIACSESILEDRFNQLDSNYLPEVVRLLPRSLSAIKPHFQIFILSATVKHDAGLA